MRTRRLLLLLLFLVALSGEALHTLSAHHDGSHCPVCTVAAHAAAPDIVKPFEPFILFHDTEEPCPAAEAHSSFALHFVPARAPPRFV
ncbi:hypothetical protein LOH54_10335 [Sulfurimonas sp. HSL-3221]|uniref:hypothetical protein n=1 Tax=Sulfurimonadaceae TaxID=2771471 RepID=UPI001E334CCF|nr:hypothetical protein [Sulfurimonas sp. HSL-3221]UFS62045.1 hypothetical protein LOH54_10335 [Sulfurimonas sp. HSL-3221]